MLEEAELSIEDLALRTGGPRSAEVRVNFVVDAMCSSSGSPLTSHQSHEQLVPDFEVIAGIGEIMEGVARIQVLVLWLERNLRGLRFDGRLHLQDATNILKINTAHEKVLSMAVSVPTAVNTEGLSEAEVASGVADVKLIVVACTASSLHRWTFTLSAAALSQPLDGNTPKVADIGRYLQRLRPWRSVAAPVVNSYDRLGCNANGGGGDGDNDSDYGYADCIFSGGSVDGQLQGRLSACALGDCNNLQVLAGNNSNHRGSESSAPSAVRRGPSIAAAANISDFWNISLFFSASIEGGVVVVRDAKLSVVCTLSPQSYARAPATAFGLGFGLGLGIGAGAGAGAEDVSGVLQGGAMFGAPTHVMFAALPAAAASSSSSQTTAGMLNAIVVVYESGCLCAWNLTPCIHIDPEELESDSFDLSALQPLLLFAVRPGYEISSVVIVPTVPPLADRRVGAGAGAGAGRSRDGQSGHSSMLSVLIGSRDGRLRLVNVSCDEHAIRIRPNLASARAGTSAAAAAAGAGNSIFFSERYVADLVREARYLRPQPVGNSDAFASVGAGTGLGKGSEEAAVSIRGSVACIPLALTVPRAAKAAGSSNASGEVARDICVVVTTQALMTLSLPSLQVIRCLPLADATGAGSVRVGGSVGVGAMALTAVAVSEQSAAFVNAFDRQARVIFFRSTESPSEATGGTDSDAAVAVTAAAAARRGHSDTSKGLSQIPRAKPKVRSGPKEAVALTALGRERAGDLGPQAEQEAGAEDGKDGAKQPLSFFLTGADVGLIEGRGVGDEDGSSGGAGAGANTGIIKIVSPLASTGTGTGASTGAGSSPGSSRKAANSSATVSAAAGAGSWEAPAGKDKKTGKVLDQPVTFHTKIKSSGYGQVPTTAMGAWEKKRRDHAKAAAASVANKSKQPRDALRSSTAPASASSAAHSPGRDGGGINNLATAGAGRRLRRYPVDGPLISTAQPHNDFTAAGVAGPLHRVSFNGDGSMIAVATSDSTVTTLKTPISRHGGDGTFYMSHNGPVTAVSFSNDRQADKQLVLSSSADGTARLWRAGKVDYSAVCFTHDRSSTNASHITTAVSSSAASKFSKGGSGGAAAASTRNRPFTGAIVDASFYYNDRFVALANGNRAMIYTYSCDGTDESNDLKRLQSNGTYRRAHLWDFPDAREITALSCMNGVLSPLFFCATSDKRLHVLDAVRGVIARSIVCPHDRAVHCVALPQPSVFSQVDSSSLEYFATAAADNCICIWDLRSPSVTSRFTGHVNRRESVRCAFSPCMRYLACGSEDKTARLVDLRTGLELARYTGHRDVVSDVAFNPIAAQLATASYDGSIKFFCATEV